MPVVGFESTDLVLVLGGAPVEVCLLSSGVLSSSIPVEINIEFQNVRCKQLTVSYKVILIETHSISVFPSEAIIEIPDILTEPRQCFTLFANAEQFLFIEGNNGIITFTVSPSSLLGTDEVNVTQERVDVLVIGEGNGEVGPVEVLVPAVVNVTEGIPAVLCFKANFGEVFADEVGNYQVILSLLAEDLDTSCEYDC